MFKCVQRPPSFAACVCMLMMGVATTAMLPAQSASPPIFNPPKSYYLALGDSIAYGYQAFKANAGLPPSQFNTGYVDLFSTRLRKIRPGIITVNYGCPGESTETFVNGPCLWTQVGRQLHDAFSGTQLEAAVSFLRAHPSQVSPVTVSLVGNELPFLLNPCTGNGQIDLGCVRDHAPAFITAVGERLSSILRELRSVAPNTEIIVTGAYDTFLNALPFADPLFQSFNAAIAEAAAHNRARFADPFPIFNPQGDQNAEVLAICTLTLLCTQNDSHPSDFGYEALSRVVFAVSDYARLVE